MDLTQEFDKTDSFIHWFIICALVGIDITEEVKKRPIDIKMTINEVEMNPLASLKRLEEEFDRLVDKKANEKIDIITDNIIEPFQEKIQELTDKLHELVFEVKV